MDYLCLLSTMHPAFSSRTEQTLGLEGIIRNINFSVQKQDELRKHRHGLVHTQSK